METNVLGVKSEASEVDETLCSGAYGLPRLPCGRRGTTDACSVAICFPKGTRALLARRKLCTLRITDMVLVQMSSEECMKRWYGATLHTHSGTVHKSCTIEVRL